MIPKPSKREYKYLRCHADVFDVSFQRYMSEGWIVDKFHVDSNVVHVIFMRLVYV